MQRTPAFRCADFCHMVAKEHTLCTAVWTSIVWCCMCRLSTPAVASFKRSLLAFCWIYYRLCIKQMQCKDARFLSLH